MKKTSKNIIFTGEQVKRLRAMPFFTAEIAEELTDTLCEYSQNEAHATRVIDRARVSKFGKAGESRVPSTADIYELCRDPDNNPTYETTASSTGCSLCRNHVGFIVQEKKGVSVAVRCECGSVPALERTTIPPPDPDVWRDVRKKAEEEAAA